MISACAISHIVSRLFEQDPSLYGMQLFSIILDIDFLVLWTETLLLFL